MDATNPDDFPDFIFKEMIMYEFQGLNFYGMHIIHENSKIYVPQKFVQAW